MPAPSLTDAYLASLDLARDEPTTDLLRSITSRHVARHAFTSIGPQLADDLPLDPDALLDRIVVRGRGGYCFEHNGLLFAVLEDLGYSPRLQMARVILRREGTGLTHRVNLVRLDGIDHVVDVGFGTLGPRFPVPIAAAPVGADHRIVENEQGGFRMEARADDDYVSLYRFELADYNASDVEIGHFYSQRHPASTFVNELLASLILDGEVRSLRGREYRVIRPDGPITTHIQDAAGLRILLQSEFGVRVTDEEAGRLLAGLPDPAADGPR